MKLNFALRTSLAALLAACYAMQPAVHRAAWENATVFAPVLAVACVSGPSLGATLEHAWEMWKATVVGCFSSGSGATWERRSPIQHSHFHIFSAIFIHFSVIIELVEP